jgi:ArsR family transcriptional regulator, zinc-responsive transcriptional repressor
MAAFPGPRTGHHQDRDVCFIRWPQPGGISISHAFFKCDPFESLTELMHLLQNRLCMRLLKCIASKPRAVTDLAEVLAVEQSGISHALAMLRHSDFLIAERRGKNVFYTLNPHFHLKVLDEHLEVILHCRNGDILHFVTTIAFDEPSLIPRSVQATSASVQPR